ncbi:MAG: RNA polymerase subunit sigma-24, partial [Chloroflexota bacterium]|nr:RNA polymerase subunit sigma-24 [Chloroflexota bacterium]
MEGTSRGGETQPLASDQRVIATIRTSDPAALEALYDLHATAVFGLLVRIVGDRSSAEDLLQDVFLRAWRNAASYHPERGQVRSWLLGIAHHAALNELRRRRR